MKIHTRTILMHGILDKHQPMHELMQSKRSSSSNECWESVLELFVALFMSRLKSIYQRNRKKRLLRKSVQKDISGVDELVLLYTNRNNPPSRMGHRSNYPNTYTVVTFTFIYIIMQTQPIWQRSCTYLLLKNTINSQFL